jgi:hypothetical protein
MFLNWIMPQASETDFVQFQNNPINILVCASTPGASNLTFWTINDTIQTSDLPNSIAPYVIFKAEEIAFGRDITVDSLLVSVRGTPGQVVNFTVYGNVSGVYQAVLTGSLTIESTTFQSQQVFWNEQVNTVRNPQLAITLPLATPGSSTQCVISKIAMFGSFDPGQRPT